MRPARILLVSTPIGRLGSGLGGGVELTIVNLARALRLQGHRVTILAPDGSVLPPDLTSDPVTGPVSGPAVAGHEPVTLLMAGGDPPPSAQHVAPDAPIVMPPNGVLANLWERARQVQGDVDLIVNLAFDWLPFYLTPFFATPLAHLISMGSESVALERAAAAVAATSSGRLAVHSHAQAATFPFADRLAVVGNGLDLDGYTFVAQAEPRLGWVGRVAPEKGLEDALAAARLAGLPLHVWGVTEDEAYWSTLARGFASTLVYRGFLPTARLQAELGRCRALLVTPKWLEAYGNVVVEALACGVPVVAYRRGGPAELVEDGRSGFVVEPDSVDALVAGVARISRLDRAECRRRARQECSLEAFAGRLEAWLGPLLA